MIDIPSHIQEWLLSVFRNANHRVTRKLDRNPCVYEEHLDMSLVECLQEEATPVRFPDDWTVQINTHFLGRVSMYRNFEVADIGFLVMFRTAGHLVRTKVALLQSKRLYPDGVEPETQEQTEARYMTGFGALFSSDEDFAILAEERIITFSDQSRYKALVPKSDQVGIIDGYEASRQIPVYYLFYNPSRLPHSVNVPTSVENPEVVCEIGTRVMPSRNVHKLLKKRKQGPTYAAVARIGAPFVGTDEAGWSFERFVVELLLQCKVGRITDVRSDEGLFQVFYRRSGPIAAAVSVTIDAPEGFDWAVEPARP